MKYVFLLYVVIAFSCSHSNWLQKGIKKGWVNKDTLKMYDTITFKGSTKDTSFIFNSDTIILKDKLFTTYYYRDTLLKREYLKTIVNNRDTVIVKEYHVDKFKYVEHTIFDALRKLWWLIALLILIIIIVKK